MALVSAAVIGAYNAVEEESKCTQGSRYRVHTGRRNMTDFPIDENCCSPAWHKDNSRDPRASAWSSTARSGVSDKTPSGATSPVPGYWSTSGISTPFEEDSDDDEEVIKAFSQPTPSQKEKSQNLVQKAKSLFTGSNTKRRSLASLGTKP
mmetsp:Transcript_3048/g.7810  ORF Transcript_3048/g.7810 Transcript_3048/m.7810 type:complete len:150 (-) Transcript_3048:225-674(-)